MVKGMNKRIRDLNREIQSGRLLEENVPKLFNHLADNYYTYASVRLAIHYYTLYETYCDEEGTWSEAALETLKKLNNIIKSGVINSLNGSMREEAIRVVDFIRSDIMEKMTAFTAYTDIFQIYEYTLNRVEYRFREDLPTIDDEDFAREILRFIFDTEDNVIVNEKIKEIIGQLPVRITKQKYFELLKDSLYAYIGADSASLEQYLYMQKTCAMLGQNETMEQLFPKLWQQKLELSQLSYKDMSQEQYEKARLTLGAATLTLEFEASVYYFLQEIVNEVYALLLCSPYQGMESLMPCEADKASLEILIQVSECFENMEKKELPEELLDKFATMEGVQEDLFFELTTCEETLNIIKVKHEELTKSLMLNQSLEVLLRSASLLSNSIFIELEVKDRVTTIVNEERVAKEMKQFQDELAELFHSQDKIITRAVMANTMNKLPVFFKDHKEVMDYILYSLDRCSDIYEKSACFEIINELMSE
ncbi:MAG: hypothetical protein K0R00_393 [Herbinix sp.]|jgi:hypothetical protein|nr:hypothetical protein [Herbinix sp.]